MPRRNHDRDGTASYVPLAQGLEISHYRIIEKIGAGGMGEVYLAEDTALHRRVALKFLPHHLMSQADAKARFTREAEAAAQLNHPNIVTIYEVGEYRGRPFFAMEHVEGCSIHHFAHERPLPFDRLMGVAIPIAEGLDKAHQAGIAHRDIKPSNIVVDGDGRPKILDFGLASVPGGDKLTKTGSTLGTVAYMSPEQAQGSAVDQRSDLFSFGVVLYELITGRTPFRRDSEAATLQAIIHDKPEPLSRFKAGVPESLQQIIDKLLEKDVETRYQSAAELLADLKRVKKLLASGEASLGKSDIDRGRRRLWRILVPTAVIVLIVLVALILKPWQFEIQPTQEATAAENRLAIMYFDNLADPEDSRKLGEIAANLLITDLSESRFVQVVSSQRLYDILKQLGREGQKDIDRNVASQIAEKAKAKWMLLGSILKMEPQIILTAQLVDVVTGDAIASQRIAGQPGEEIFTLVDQLTVEIKNDLALPDSAQAEPDRPVAEATTHSPEAYRYYLEGVNLGYKYYRPEAIDKFKKAVALDSTFAMAYFRWSSLTRGLERRRLVAKALKYLNNASRDEQCYIQGWYAFTIGDYTSAIANIREILDRHPDDKEAWRHLGYIYDNGLRQVDEAINYYSRVIEIDSLDAWIFNEMAYLYNQIGNFEKSMWAINKYVSLQPDEANPYDSRGELYASNGKLDQAIASFRKAVEIKPDFYGSWENLGTMLIFKRDYAQAQQCYEKLLSSANKNVRADGRGALAYIPIYRGKFNQALEILNQGIAADQMDRTAQWEKLIQKSHLYAQQGDLEQSISAMQEAIHVYGEHYPERSVPFTHIYLQRLAENGDFDRARQIAQEWRREIEEDDPTRMDYYIIGLGCLQFARAKYDTAIAYFSEAVAGLPDPLTARGFRARFLLARAYQEAGQRGEAVVEFEKILNNYSGGRIAWAISSVKAHYYLGQAYEQSGWQNKAIAQYEEFLEIWRDADPGIPEVADAKTRLARLQSAS